MVDSAVVTSAVTASTTDMKTNVADSLTAIVGTGERSPTEAAV